jgi:hypothetical protein
MRYFTVKKTAGSMYAGECGEAVMYGNATRNWKHATSKAKYVCLVFNYGKFAMRPMWFHKDELRSRIT